MIWLLMFIIPILLVFFGYLIFSYYTDNIKKQTIMDGLTFDNAKIIDKVEYQEKINFDKKNWLQSKLNYAGFQHESALYVFILISILFGGLSSSFVYCVIPNVIALVICFVLFSFFPYLIVLKLISFRQEEFNESLKDIIDKVASMMKSGLGFEQSLRKSVHSSKSEFAKKVFGIYLHEKDIIGEIKAFGKMFELVDSKELRIFYLTIAIGRQSGGKFSNTLDKLRNTLQSQGELKKEIISSTREIKIGTYMILVLFVGIYMIMNALFDNALNEHFFNSEDGNIQIFFISLWVAFGIFVNNLLTKIR